MDNVDYRLFERSNQVVQQLHDKLEALSHTAHMSERTPSTGTELLSALEERMDKRIERMAQESRHELALRDEQIRREQDLRQESFRAEQAARDQAAEARYARFEATLTEKFSGFLAAQAERDKAFEKLAEARFERIEKDIASIKGDAKTITTDVQGIKVTMAKYLGGAVVIGAIASAMLGAALRYLAS